MIRKNKKFIDPRYFMDEKMELNEVSSMSSMEVFGIHDISDPTVLIQAVSDLLAKEPPEGISKDKVGKAKARAIEDWLTSRDQKLQRPEDRPLKDELKRLRDQVLLAAGLGGSLSTKSAYTIDRPVSS